MFRGLSKTLFFFITSICCNKKSESGIPYSLFITGDKVKNWEIYFLGYSWSISRVINKYFKKGCDF